MNTHNYRLLAGLLTTAALTAALPFPALGAESAAGLTRAEARDLLLAAADDYRLDTQAEEILKGDERGELHLNRVVTRAEALVMLERAFGGLPEPVGANARNVFPAETFSDVPAWAADELTDVFSAGIVAGTGEGIFSPDRPVTKEELETLVKRVYALKGSNVKDDFYAAVNRDWLNTSTIPAGQMINGALYGVTYQVNEQVADLITNIAAQTQEKGSAEAKIAALYHTVMDTESRNREGAAPIQGYLDELERAGTLEELLAAECRIQKDLGIATLLGYSLSVDLADSSRYTVTFSTFGPSMDKEFYTNSTQEKKELYLGYLTKLMTLSGYDEETAAKKAELVYQLDAAISAVSLNPQDAQNIEKIYNIYSSEELAALFPNVDLNQVYAASGLQPTEQIEIRDKDAVQTAASFFTSEHLEGLKAEAQVSLISSVCGCFNQEFLDASFDFRASYYHVDGRMSTEQIAAQQVQSLLSDYLSRAYAETYFSAEAKADVESMVDDFLKIYANRIRTLDWMSDQTKEEALKKLESMRVKVGYPDDWSTYLDNVEIQTPEEGGTFFSNVIAIQKAAMDYLRSRQDKGVDKDAWITPTYTVNAFYNASSNDITFPAAILQTPMYDMNASREENLGGIGYIIAHEITHAFDNNGCKFDENGNVAVTAENPYGWWTETDYTAFQTKCTEVAAWYDGQESIPGVLCSGALTLSENVADLGGASCIVEAASQLSEPNYETLFRAMAQTWVSTSSRETQEYLATTDVHAPDKIRINRVLQTLPEFYETFQITERDGMWVPSEDRVSVW